MSHELSAGVARVDITPPVGISMAGYYARDGVSKGVERPLTATTVVLSNGSVKIAVVACDLIFLQSPDVDRVRARIGGAIGTSGGNVLMNFNHTHCGPTPPSWGLHATEEQQAIQRANRSLVPARVGTGTGSCVIGINRREVGEDGKVFLGENPDGPMDSMVGVIRVDKLDGSPLAVLFSYGCHTVTMGPKNLRLSPDFPGPARDLIEASTGATSLFLQGAAGNINPITGIGATEDDTENMTRLGNILGAEVVKTAMGIRTHQKRGPRTFFSSLSKNSLYPYVAIEDRTAELASVSEIFELPLMPFPEEDEARRILEFRRDQLVQAQKKGTPGNLLAIYHRFHDWALIMYSYAERGQKQATLPVNFQAIRINDLGIAAVSGETVVELGLATKAVSPFKNTIFLGYSNGCASYMPTAECYPEGGWSPWETYSVPDMLFQTYQVPMALSPDSGQMIIDRSVELLNRLSGVASVGR
jgi:neutral ceramidase